MENKGLGDTLENFFILTGIKKIADTISGGGCGCNERRDSLNRMVPYNK